MPSFIHHSAKRDSPHSAREANGAPLSRANRLRHAIFAKGRFEDRLHPCRCRCWPPPGSAADIGCARPRWSADRCGSPSPVRNQPLKSAHHTRFGASARGEAVRCRARSRRRCLRATTRPFASDHLSDGARRRPASVAARLPLQHLLQLARSPAHVGSAATPAPAARCSPRVWLGCRCGARSRLQQCLRLLRHDSVAAKRSRSRAMTP